jgi:deoxyribodipyrimidine photo-lyase
VLFTRDLRIHDNPALAEACANAARVVPLFVFDPTALTGPHRSPNRVRFLLRSLAELRRSLRDRGGDLLLRHGDPVTETMRLAEEVAADYVYTADDVSGYAARRRRLLADACREARRGLSLWPGVTVVPPAAVTTSTGGAYRVFTPYLRAWSRAERRELYRPPARIRTPTGLRAGRLPLLSELVQGRPSPEVVEGGEAAGRARMRAWMDGPLRGYDAGHDDLAGDRTSRLSAYLHFGCLSPAEVAEAGAASPGFVRQLAWRDFYHQLTDAFPGITGDDFRPRERTWRNDPEGFAAWRDGRTGIPIVDAGMRQLLAEGWMHNRARLITASFLCHHLGLDWRTGGRHFMEWLVDGDLANNYGNWQWVAGTGTNPRPNVVFNPRRQARRFDPAGTYVRRYVPELAGTDRRTVHHPWEAAGVAGRDYPAPLVDLPAG